MNFELFSNPNKHARKADFKIFDHGMLVHGYQEFKITSDSLTLDPIDEYQIKKKEALNNVFQPNNFFKRTVLDLGGNSGFYSLWALKVGASSACVNDIDEEYIKILNAIKMTFKIQNLSTNNQNIQDITIKSDVVIALALIHWIYSCTASHGNLSDAIEHLASLCNYMLIIEWIDPLDPAISFFHHLDWNQSSITGPYNQEEFEKALSKNFPRWRRESDVTGTRSIYVAFKQIHEIDLSFPLPLLRDEKSIISSRMLTTSGGINYWSIVYDLEGTILKQTTGNLAYRESMILDLILENNEFFPRVIKRINNDDYSTIEISRFDGKTLNTLSPDEIAQCIGEAVFKSAISALIALENSGIVHRDIRPSNILVDGNDIKIIDFGWAVSKDMPQSSPPGLGGVFRPSDGTFSDIFSMARSLIRSNIEFSKKEMQLLRYMSMEDQEFRLQDLAEIEKLFKLEEKDAANFPKNDLGSQDRISMLNLLEQIDIRGQRISLLEKELESKNKKLDELQVKVNEHKLIQLKLNSELAEHEQTVQKLKFDLTEHEQTVQKLKFDLAEQDSKSKNLQFIIQSREDEIKQYLTSTSWKLTLPLRKISSFFRDLRRK
ncbi:MAG: hypothetical protein VB108_11800 [Anaerolineaceae bacterium]|nr:hypothetical protein [Anaerolineaceae bacterium]